MVCWHRACFLAGLGFALFQPPGAVRAASGFSPKPLSASNAVPPQVAAPLLARMPGALLVSHVACKVGTVHAIAHALVVAEKNAGGGIRDVRAAVVVKTDTGWKLDLLPDRIDIPGGGFQRGLFLEFVEDGRVTEPVNIKCTTPAKDEDVLEERGHWLLDDERLRTSQQICFAISIAYNNWSCYAYDEKRMEMRPSFAQLQAD